METYQIELGERVVRYLNGGIDRNPEDRWFMETYPANVWGEAA